MYELNIPTKFLSNVQIERSYESDAYYLFEDPSSLILLKKSSPQLSGLFFMQCRNKIERFFISNHRAVKSS